MSAKAKAKSKSNPMLISPGTLYRVRGAQQVESFAASGHVIKACRHLKKRLTLQRDRPSGMVENFVDDICGLAVQDNADFLEVDLEVRALEAIHQCKIEQRADVVGEVTALLTPVARLSNKIPDRPGYYSIWLLGEVERRPDYVYHQAEDLTKWLERQDAKPIGPEIPGFIFSAADLAAAVHLPADKLGELLDDIDQIKRRLELAQIRRREADEKSKGSYLASGI